MRSIPMWKMQVANRVTATIIREVPRSWWGRLWGAPARRVMSYEVLKDRATGTTGVINQQPLPFTFTGFPTGTILSYQID